MDDSILIVGAGHAGGTAAALLRQNGHSGAITLIGAEPLAPYQHPPLSKGWLKGEVSTDDLLLRPSGFYADKEITLRTGARVLSIDPAAHRVTLEDGESLAFARLILATGSRLRRLDAPGTDLPGVLALRSVDDAQRLRAALVPGSRLAVVGGGYIGLEVAASARALGVRVRVFEREPRLLARVASAPIAEYFATLHRSHGVEIETGAELATIEARDGRAGAVLLRDGRRFECDAVLVGVGAHAEDALAAAAGIACEDGILVDDCARTSHEGIYAIGDCTRRPVPPYGHSMRLESVPNAIEQAKQVAAHICGKPAPRPEAPWFWSEQYDCRLQIAGLAIDAPHTVLRGDPASGKFAVFHLDAEGRLRAVEAVNAARDFLAGRQLVAAAARPDPARIADPALPQPPELP